MSPIASSDQPSGGLTVDDAGMTISKEKMGLTNGVTKETTTETVDSLFVKEAPQAASDQTAREKWMNDMFCEHTKDMTPANVYDPANPGSLVTIPLDAVERLASEEPLSADLKPVAECNLSAGARRFTPVCFAAKGKYTGHLSSEGMPVLKEIPVQMDISAEMDLPMQKRGTNQLLAGRIL